jgi:hypothetical protein
MPVNMNVYAQTEEDLYKDPYAKPKPKRSFDSLIEEFNSVRSAEATELRNQFWQIEAQIETLLAAHKAEKLLLAEEKLETAILASRKLQKEFSAAKDETFKARQEYARLEGVSEAASNRHEAMADDFKQKSLLTKSEKAEWVEKIAVAKQRSEATFLAESNQQTVHNNLVYREAEAAKAYTDSVNVVNDIQREINRLSK